MSQSRVNKGVCLKIFKTGFQCTYPLEDFRGQAGKWRKFNEPDFQEFAQKHSITPKTNIIIYDGGFDGFGVNILR